MHLSKDSYVTHLAHVISAKECTSKRYSGSNENILPPNYCLGPSRCMTAFVEREAIGLVHQRLPTQPSGQAPKTWNSRESKGRRRGP